MKGALPETQIIFNKLLNDNQQKVILKRCFRIDCCYLTIL